MEFEFSDVKHRAAYVLGLLLGAVLFVGAILLVIFVPESPVRKALLLGGSLYFAYGSYCAMRALRLLGATVEVGDAGIEIRRGTERRTYRWGDGLSVKNRASVQMLTLLDRDAKEIFTIDYGFVSDRTLTYILVEKIANPDVHLDYDDIRARAKADNRQETKRMILGAIGRNIGLRL